LQKYTKRSNSAISSNIFEVTGKKPHQIYKVRGVGGGYTDRFDMEKGFLPMSLLGENAKKP
jgi:hypothetical protein